MFEMEEERFRAEAGCGIAELKFMPPNVCKYQYNKFEYSCSNLPLAVGAH